MTRSMRTIVSVVALVFPTFSVAYADTVFSDQTFNNSDWSRSTFTSGNAGSSSASQQTAGGNPDNYFQVTNSVNADGSVDAFYGRTASTYTPSSQGAITSIDYSVDQNLFGGSVGDAELAIEQNGNIYFAFPEVNVFSSGWTTFTLDDLTAASFALLVPGSNNGFDELVFDSTQNPDFSATASAIEFGFGTTFNSPAGGNSFNGTWGVDNWNVTLHTSVAAIPEPEIYAMLAAGLGLVGWMARRNMPLRDISG